MHPSTFPFWHVSLDDYADGDVPHFIFPFAIVQFFILTYFWLYYLLILLNPEKISFETVSSLDNMVRVQHVHQIYYVIIPILHYDNSTSLRRIRTGFRLFQLKFFHFSYILFILLWSLNLSQWFHLAASQVPTQRVALSDGRTVGWYLKVLSTCGGSEWCHVNRALQYWTIVPRHSWQQCSTIGTWWHWTYFW